MTSSQSPKGKIPIDSGSKTGDEALSWIADRIKSGKAKKVVVLTGAGISTSAGIPDFRSPETGLYANLQALNLPFPEAVFELNFFKSNPKPFWTLAKEIYPGKHLPTPTHYFIKLLHDKGILTRVFTQNIDTLEHLTSLPSDKIIEAHGSFATAHCLDCGADTSTEYVLASGVRKGETVYCAEEGCEGLVKPDIVFFGEGLPDKFFKRLNDLSESDLVIIIGTSLQVQPFSLLPERAKSTTPRLLINREAVGPFESLQGSQQRGSREHFLRMIGGGGGRSMDRFWKGDADDGVRQLCDELGWRDDLERLVKKGRTDLERKWESMEKASKAASLGVKDENRDDKEDTETRQEEVVEVTKGDTASTTAHRTAKEIAEEVPEPETIPEASSSVTPAPDDVDDLEAAVRKDLKL